MPTWNPTSGNNYNLAANWDTAAVPTTTTDAIFDGSVSNADCIVNSANLLCLGFKVINGYSGTITFNFDLNLYGNYEVDAASATSWTFSAPATAGLLFRVSATIDIPTTRVDSNIGMFILTAGVNVTLTLARDTTIANFTRTWNNPNGNISFVINRTSPGNGDNLYVTGNFTHQVFTGTGTFGGTTTINFTTSTTSTLAITSAGLASDVVFNGTGTFTGTFAPGAGNTTTYTSGDTTGLNLFLVRSATIISNGTTWNNVDFRPVSSQTLTINTDLIYGGVLSAFTSFRWDISHISGSVIRCRGTGFNTANLRNADVIIETALPCTVSLSNQNDNMDLTFNPFPNGQITWVGGLFIGTSTLTYLTSNGGPVPLVTGAISLNSGSNTTFDTSPSPTNYIIFGNLTSTSTATMILTTDLHFNGTLSKSNSNVTVNTSTGSKLILGGSTNTDSGNLLGTATVQLGYTGTWNNAITIQNDLLISPLSGETVTIRRILKSGNSITYTPSGTLDSSASDLTITGSVTMSTLMSWYIVRFATTVTTLTLNQDLTVTGGMIFTNSSSFSGTNGFVTDKLLFATSTANQTLTFTAGITYRIISSLIAYSTSNATTFRSDTTSSDAYLELDTTASQLVFNINATDIDSSGTLGVLPYSKQTIYSLNGTLTRTTNWIDGVSPGPTPPSGGGEVSFVYVY